MQVYLKYVIGMILKTLLKDFPGSPVVKTPHFLQGAWVRSLIRELRSHTLHSQVNFFKKLNTLSSSYRTKERERHRKETGGPRSQQKGSGLRSFSLTFHLHPFIVHLSDTQSWSEVAGGGWRVFIQGGGLGRGGVRTLSSDREHIWPDV